MWFIIVVQQVAQFRFQYSSVLVRIPVIAGFNDSDLWMRNISTFLRELEPSEGVELLRGHDHAAGKYTGLGREAKCYVPAVESVEKFRKILQDAGLTVLSGG